MIDHKNGLVGLLQFFVYDSVKIMLLLFVMISFVGFLRSYLSQGKVRSWLAKKKFFANIYASMFGAITPFCSCSSIPIFLGFLKTGVPLGVTFSFLITSPLVNEYLVVLMLGFFGWKITAFYVLSGIFLGVFVGLILGKMKLDKYIDRDFLPIKTETEKLLQFTSIKDRILFGVGEAKLILKRLWPWILIGVGIGAVIHNYVPKETIQGAIAKTGPFSVPIAVLLGVPMYGSCAAIVPIAVALFRKGVPLGTALAFMMAVSALSLPEAVILRRAMKLKLVIIFFGITTLGIIFTGYLFNLLSVKLLP
ncbi:MAG: permease [Candidatus Omnitrophota bacterium]